MVHLEQNPALILRCGVFYFPEQFFQAAEPCDFFIFAVVDG
jgi:hypothetical protein